MKIITVIGARPQFIKAAAVSRAILLHNEINLTQIEEKIIHTGQHFDNNMSEIFFKELELQKPDYNLAIAELVEAGLRSFNMNMPEEINSLKKRACNRNN